MLTSLQKYSLIFLLLLASNSILAQFKFDFSSEIGVRVGSDTLAFPWAGGLNNVQFSTIDFDFDGDEDLFVFDRSRDNVRLFENALENGARMYKSVPFAADFFPSGIRYRVALADFNQDGKKDLFTYGVGGVKVYKNTGNSSTGLTWELQTNLIYSDYNGTISNLYVSSSDIPAYVDVDFDGDLDILTFHIGGQRMEYHQNQSQELYGHSDSLIFILKNECWGKFTEDANNNSLTLNDPNSPCSSGNIPDPQRYEEETGNRHAGSTVLAIDIDNSGVLDLILGDVAHTNLNLLINGGTEPNTNSAMIQQDNNFPSNTTPANMQLFPAAFYEDIDFDGKKDLLVGANARGVSQNEKSVLMYKNVGSNENPIFSYRTNQFLQAEMIDVGTGAIPVFFDANADGKEDLIVSQLYRYKEPLEKETALNLYRNTGTATEPFFSFIESNYLNFLDQNLGLRPVPTFGDVDGDGDLDLFIGLENGTLSYRENTAAPGSIPQFGTALNNYIDNQNQVISAGSYGFPQLFDLDNDGLIDLCIGKKTGELIFYKNVGTTTEPNFELANQLLGNIDIAPSNPEGYAAPHFFRFEDTTYLLLGGIDGKIRFYHGIDSNLETGDSFELISDYFRNISVEGYSSCWVNDIDQDGKLNLFVGGDLGGIFALEHNPASQVSIQPITSKVNFTIFPNPSTGKMSIQLQEEVSQKTVIQITNMQGKRVFETELKNQQSDYDFSTFQDGMYFILLMQSNGTFIQKWVKY